jgi:hypothetical protein
MADPKRIHFTLEDGTQGSMTEEEARRLNIRAYQSKNDAKTSPNHRTSMIVDGGGPGKIKKAAQKKRLMKSKRVKTLIDE